MMFGFKPYDTQIEIATKRFFIPNFMKTIASQILHLFRMDRLHTYLLEVVLVVCQGNAKGIDYFQVNALYLIIQYPILGLFREKRINSFF